MTIITTFVSMHWSTYIPIIVLITDNFTLIQNELQSLMFSEAIAIANLPSEHPELTHKDNFKLKFYDLKTKYYA